MTITNPYTTLPSSTLSSPSSSKSSLSFKGEMEDKDLIPSTVPKSSCHNFANYDIVKIGDLAVGPARITFIGRVVNILHRPWSASSSSPDSSDDISKPSGYFKLVISDGTGVVVVKLFYAALPSGDPSLDSLVRIHATHVSPQEPNSLPAKHDGFFISVFPERDRFVSVSVLDETEEDNATACRKPLTLRPGLRSLRGMKTLSEVMSRIEPKEGRSLRALVVVKRIGLSRRICFKKNDTDRMSTIVEVVVCDMTCDAILSVWDCAVQAVKYWKPAETVLLLTKPEVKGEDPKRRKLMLALTTTVDINPEIPAATELRTWAKRKQREESINIPFPEGVFDITEFLDSTLRIKFTLGEIDEFARAGEKETYIGYFSLIIFECNLTKLHLRNMLCSGECCGNPIFANSVTEICQSCGREVILRLNPGIVSTLSDETGSISGHKLIWSDRAWKRLLGRSADLLMQEPFSAIRKIQCALLYCRVTLLMGWSPEVGRLMVCDIHA